MADSFVSFTRPSVRVANRLHLYVLHAANFLFIVARFDHICAPSVVPTENGNYRTPYAEKVDWLLSISLEQRVKSNALEIGQSFITDVITHSAALLRCIADKISVLSIVIEPVAIVFRIRSPFISLIGKCI